jgi:hypothetical protein
MFTAGFLPGRGLAERVASLRDPLKILSAVPAARAAVHAFLTAVVPQVRARFGGPVSYASVPFEGVDWAPFDIIANDGGYRDRSNIEGFPQALAAAVSQGKPYAVTEFGCCTVGSVVAVSMAAL